MKYYDEADKRLFFKIKEGEAFNLILTDCVIEANLGQTLATYDNFEILSKMMPAFYDIEWLSKVTNNKGIMYGK